MSRSTVVLVDDPVPAPPYYVGPTFRGEWPVVECATWPEAVACALALALEGRAVVVRDASRCLVTTGRRVVAASLAAHAYAAG